MRQRYKKLQPLLILLAALLLVYIAWQADLAGIFRYIQALPKTLLLALVGLQLVTQLLLNFQWYRLCRVLGWPTSFGKLLVVNAYGMVADAITPGEKVGGEVARVVKLHSYLGYTSNQSTALVTIQKALSLAALVLLNMAVIATMSEHISFLQWIPMRILMLAVLLAIGVLLFCLLFRTQQLNARFARVQTTKRWVLWLQRWVDEFAQHTHSIRQCRGEWVLQFLLSVAIWAIFPLKLVLLVLIHLDTIPLFVLFGITFVSYFAAMIPLLPGGLGTFEATMSGMLIAYGLLFNQAAAVAIVFRFITFWFVLLLSLLIIGVYKAIVLYQRRHSGENNRQIQ